MIIVLNGPIGIGKSTLAETIMERTSGCALLDGDWLIAVNPPCEDELEHLHATLVTLMEHHRRFGYRHFVVNHIWRSAAGLEDLRLRTRSLDPAFHCFLLTLPLEENVRRIERRARAREADELEWERGTLVQERAALAAGTGGLGEPFDMSASPDELAERVLKRVGLR